MVVYLKFLEGRKFKAVLPKHKCSQRTKLLMNLRFADSKIVTLFRF